MPLNPVATRQPYAHVGVCRSRYVGSGPLTPAVASLRPHRARAHPPRRKLGLVTAGRPPKETASDLIVPFEDTGGKLDALPVMSKPEGPSYSYKYLFDGGCSVCTSVVAMLKSRRGHENIYFEDISLSSFKPAKNMGISYDEAMTTVHVITKEQQIIQGMDALAALYGEVGLGWVFRLASLPGFSKAAELAYKLVSKNRQSMGGALDAGLLAMGRINMEKEGTGSCTDPEGECRNSPILDKSDSDDEEEDEDGKPLLKGADRDHVLGVYLIGRGQGMRAAPIDIKTGEFITNGALRPITGRSITEVAEAVRDVDLYFKWDGNVGLGLPGYISPESGYTSRDDGMMDSLSEDILGTLDENELEEAGGFSVDLGDSRACRHQMEIVMRDAIQRDVAVMTGAEAHGWGEMAYGAGRGEDGLVAMITLGIGFGVALFDGGVLVRHMDLNALKSWNGNQWIGAPLPEEGSTDAGAWQRWAERVEQYICELETVCNPEVIIIGGAALRSFNDWVPRMKKVRAAVKCGQLGKLAGVKGSAYGASFQLKMRDDLRKVRAAVGNSLGASPQKITDSQLQELFNSFDASKNDSISPTELVSLLSAVGVKLPENEMRELVFEMDEDNSGSISFHEFSEWWKEEFATPLVELMHTEAELDQVFAEEMASNRLVVLEVGFTFCRPCRAFEEKYKAFAREFKDARFLRCNGNENADMIHLGRDRLQIKSTPTFFLFRKGEQIDMWGGASEVRFRQKLMRALLAEEQGYDAEYVYSEEEPSK